MIVAGSFLQAGAVNASNVAMWNGNEWSALGEGLVNEYAQCYVSSIIVAPSIGPGIRVFVGGMFSRAGGISASLVAMWNGDHWESVGNWNFPYTESVNAMAWMESRLFVGGYMESMNNIASWDGAKWSGLGSGLDASVRSLAVFDSRLYAGGEFKHAGRIAVNSIAVWDGRDWSALGQGFDGVDSVVTALVASGSCLFVGGNFHSTGSSGLVAWTKDGWDSLGEGIQGGRYTTVYAMAVSEDGSELVVGGDFSRAGSLNTSNIASLFTLPTVATPHPDSLLTLEPVRSPSTARVSQAAILASTFAVSLLVAVALVAAKHRSARVSECLPLVDLFSLGHFVPPSATVRNLSTAFGGACSVAMVVAVTGLSINVAIGYISTPVVASTGVVPASTAMAQSLAQPFQLALFASSPYAGSQCPLLTNEDGVESMWRIERVPLPNEGGSVAPGGTVCSFLASCIACSSKPSRVAFRLPRWFSSLSWTAATHMGHFVDEAGSLSKAAGEWARPVSPFVNVSTVQVQVEVTDDIRVLNELPVSTGFVLDYQSMETTFSSNLDPSGNLFHFEFVPGGFVFQTRRVTGETALAEAVSTLLGGVSGLVAAFGFIVARFDQISVWVASKYRDKRLNFADMPLDWSSSSSVELEEPLLSPTS